MKLSVWENMEEFDWITEINREQKYFRMNKRGLFAGL